jgi:predicted DNA-binding protein
MAQKEKLLNLRVSEDFNKRLNRAAEILDRPYSQIVREAVDEKLAQIAEQYPKHKKELLPAAA